MFFTRTYSFQSPLVCEDLKNRLVGNHVKIHDLDFEVTESDEKIRIIPHAEYIESIKTLPITKIDFQNNGDKTKVVVTSKVRKIDLGGPQLIIIFCSLLLGISGVLYFVSGDPTITYILSGASLGIFTIFWIRMETGYFDYVRKIRSFVKARTATGLVEQVA